MKSGWQESQICVFRSPSIHPAHGTSLNSSRGVNSWEVFLHALSTILLARWQNDLPPHCRICWSFLVQETAPPAFSDAPPAFSDAPHVFSDAHHIRCQEDGLLWRSEGYHSWLLSLKLSMQQTFKFYSYNLYFCPWIYGGRGFKGCLYPRTSTVLRMVLSFHNSHPMWNFLHLANFRKYLGSSCKPSSKYPILPILCSFLNPKVDIT